MASAFFTLLRDTVVHRLEEPTNVEVEYGCQSWVKSLLLLGTCQILPT